MNPDPLYVEEPPPFRRPELPPADPLLMGPAEPWYDNAILWLVVGGILGFMLGAVVMGMR